MQSFVLFVSDLFISLHSGRFTWKSTVRCKCHDKCPKWCTSVWYRGVVGAHETGVFFNRFCKLPRLIVSGSSRFTGTLILVSVPFPFPLFQLLTPPPSPTSATPHPTPFFCSLIPRLFRFPIWRWRWTGLAQLPRTFLAVDLLKGGKNVFIRNAYGRYRMVRKLILPLSNDLLNSTWAILSLACVQTWSP